MNSEKRDPYVIDCFLFFNEIDILKFRLKELEKYVDYFVIVEATHTFSGIEKPLYFKQEDFPEFKFVHIVVDTKGDKNTSAWDRETQQRNAIKEGLDKLALCNEDLIVISDVDEIPDVRIFDESFYIKSKTLYSLEQDMYYYNLTNKFAYKWYRSKVCKFDFLKSDITIEAVRLMNRTETISFGGWHLSYFSDVSGIIKKIQSFSHQEYNTPELTNPEKILDIITNNKDLFNRVNPIRTPIKDNFYLPIHYEMLTEERRVVSGPFEAFYVSKSKSINVTQTVKILFSNTPIQKGIDLNAFFGDFHYGEKKTLIVISSSGKRYFIDEKPQTDITLEMNSGLTFDKSDFTAYYGGYNKFVNVSHIIKASFCISNEVLIPKGTNLNSCFGDPCIGKEKFLILTTTKTRQVIKENATKFNAIKFDLPSGVESRHSSGGVSFPFEEVQEIVIQKGKKLSHVDSTRTPIQKDERFTVGFFCYHLSKLGTTTAIYDYAYYNEKLLGNKSIVFYPSYHKENFEEYEELFKSTFTCYTCESITEIKEIIKKEGIDAMYILKAGVKDNVLFGECSNLVHSVFDNDPHGDRYAFISEWLVQKWGGERAYVPHIINLPTLPKSENLREWLKIPEDAIVFGSYGGAESFNIEFASTVVNYIVETRKDIYFLFMNFLQNTQYHPRIIYLKPTIDRYFKVKFISTCDAMIHARKMGESFGLSIGEFSSLNKPIITFFNEEHEVAKGDYPYDKEHLRILGNHGIYYKNDHDLTEILLNFEKREGVNCYGDFTPEKVMKKFEDTFLVGLKGYKK